MSLTRSRRATLIAAIAGVAILSVGACTHMMQMMHGTGAVPPAAEEFGLGPRASAGGLYTARLDPAAPLKVRSMQSVDVVITDARGAAVEDAAITVDGGMPQHGHGLPTSPRVTRHHGAGVYQIDGVRFNMGGWWELKLAIATAAGADSVTFNLEL